MVLMVGRTILDRVIRNENKAFRVLVSGSTGLVGSALVEQLQSDGCDVVRLTRSTPRADHRNNEAAVEWHPNEERIDALSLQAAPPNAIVHLAGETIAGRWSEKKKRAIRDSRVKGTRTLAGAAASLAAKPLAFICASAIGIYGDRGDELLNESSAPGSGFLPDVCIEWEKACEPARQAGIRVVNLRFGLILSPAGGALAQMLTPFKLGIAGVIGSGDQWWSWIALDDVVSVIERSLTDEALSGPINVVAPHPVTNRQFTKTLGSVLHRPTVAPVPKFAARLAFGREMADETLLASAKVEPAKLREIGFEFEHPQLERALHLMLGAPAEV